MAVVEYFLCSCCDLEFRFLFREIDEEIVHHFGLVDEKEESVEEASTDDFFVIDFDYYCYSDCEVDSQMSVSRKHSEYG